jgi:L-2-hydroxyglutarate oxidase LhgO
MEKVDAVVIGAGVVGLAAARALALAGREVLVLEAEPAIGTQTSARNSEVIHAGIYYPRGSWKARLCVQGREQLYAYCADRHIGHQRLGKLVVATSSDHLPMLHELVHKALENGVSDLALWPREQVLALEPELDVLAAVWSPSTGIVDSHGLMLALQADLEHAGGMVACHAQVEHLSLPAADSASMFEIRIRDGTELLARTLVNAGGLQAVQLAKGLYSGVPDAYFAKGNYFHVSGRVPFKHLIYPVPQAAGLGVHLTLDLGGQAKFGPDVEWVNSPLDVQVNPARLAAFETEIRKYWPGLADGVLQPGYAGIRPKISGPGEPAQDFMILGPRQHGVSGLVHLLGIESPGLTSCLALADVVVQTLSA